MEPLQIRIQKKVLAIKTDNLGQKCGHIFILVNPALSLVVVKLYRYKMEATFL